MSSESTLGYGVGPYLKKENKKKNSFKKCIIVVHVSANTHTCHNAPVVAKGPGDSFVD